MYIVSGYVTDSSQTLRVFGFYFFLFFLSLLSFVIINYGIFQANVFCCFKFFALLLFHFLSSDFMNVHIHWVLRRKFSVATNWCNTLNYEFMPLTKILFTTKISFLISDEKLLLWIRLIHSKLLEQDTWPSHDWLMSICVNVKSTTTGNIFMLGKIPTSGNFSQMIHIRALEMSCIFWMIAQINELIGFRRDLRIFFSGLHFRLSFNYVLIRKSHWLRRLGNWECKIALSANKIPINFEHKQWSLILSRECL